MLNIKSVYVPTYNVAKYIRYCIESVLAQTYSNLDILIVDDNSKDDTMEILYDLLNVIGAFELSEIKKTLDWCKIGIGVLSCPKVSG
jgi:cellulose synthase/poly-beta-1,6-N-acetylglucosamine synthase-like glycosyltransferase